MLRPLRIALVSQNEDEAVFSVHNYRPFQSLVEYCQIHYTLTEGAKKVDEGQAFADAPPSGDGAFRVQLRKPPMEDMYITFTYTLLHDEAFRGKGFELGFDQIRLSVPKADPVIEGTSVLEHYEDESAVTVSGEGFRYVFDKQRGTLREAFRDNQELLARPMRYSLWRAPMDNDRHVRATWEAAGLDHVVAKVYSNSVSERDGVLTISSNISLAPVGRQPCFRGSAMYSFNGDGEILFRIKGERDMIFPSFPRFGIAFSLVSTGHDRYSYFGYGPGEGYQDMRHALKAGLYKGSVEKLHVDRVKPQESGSRWGVTQLQAGRLVASGKPFSFNASYYTEEELTEARHNYELRRSGNLEVRLDWKMAGAGSASCGTTLLPKYQVRDKYIDWTIKLAFV